MIKDYKKIWEQQPIQYDKEVEAALVADAPNDELETIINFIIQDGRGYTDDLLNPGTGDLINYFTTISDDDIDKFCTEYADYRYWAELMVKYVEFNPDLQKGWTYYREKAKNILSIFEYHHDKTLPKFWFKNKTSQTISPAPVQKPSTPPQSNSSDSIDAYILVKNKEAFKAMMTRLLKGKKGKNAASLVYGAVQNGYMQKPTFSILQSAFGIIGVKQGFDKYYNDKHHFVGEDAKRAVYTIKCQYEEEVEKTAIQ